MKARVAVVPAVLAVSIVAMAMASPASAGVWAWGCMGKLGNERVIFDRNTLIVTESKQPAVKLEQLGNSGSTLETQDGLTFDNLGGNDGLEKSMSFKINDTTDRKLTLIETSSRKTFYRKGHVGRREEYTTKFQKTFRYVFDKEPERTIKMQCIDYVLTTCGGPCS